MKYGIHGKVRNYNLSTIIHTTQANIPDNYSHIPKPFKQANELNDPRAALHMLHILTGQYTCTCVNQRLNTPHRTKLKLA